MILDWMERRGWIRKREEPIPEYEELRLAVENFGRVLSEAAMTAEEAAANALANFRRMLKSEGPCQ